MTNVNITINITSEQKHIINITATILNLTLNLLNFINGIIHLQYLELSIIIFRDIKIET